MPQGISEKVTMISNDMKFFHAHRSEWRKIVTRQLKSDWYIDNWLHAVCMCVGCRIDINWYNLKLFR